ncbi:MAG: MBL fold metallo-hydrolase [Alphaproteobacteria bacterium]
MAATDEIDVGFWGVRGRIPRPGPETLRYGGNTPCIEMRPGAHRLIFDAGTGIRPLGDALNAEVPVSAHIFFSQTCFERIGGIPFFAAAYNPKNRFRLWAASGAEKTAIRDVLADLMTDPVFPVPIDIMGATLAFEDFAAGETLEPAQDLRVRTAALNRGTPATGYRVEWAGKSVAYVSDLVAAPDGDEAAALALLADADLAILNTAESDAQPSDWRAGLRLCDAAQVATCVLFHHHPDDDDAALDAIAAEADALRPGTVVAREGLTLTV